MVLLGPQDLVSTRQTIGQFNIGEEHMLAEKPLARELTYYEQHKNEWLPAYEGQFVVIAETNVAGFYPDYESAWDAGAQQFGADSPFLIKQISLHEPVYLVY